MSEAGAQEAVQRLLGRGVVFPAPHTVDIGPEVDPGRIAEGVVIHAGCRLRGIDTSIGPGCVLGREQPLTLVNSQLGHEVTLAGGSVEGATFLDGASMGSGVHVRAGTLVEEEASGAHTVGLKQTLLMPFVTLGSLVNFCDCLMTGGTGRKNHSEVGSSYVHFNFTPQGDKATASLLGDVPRGVMLNEPPVFLGGQGGLVGPTLVMFGCTVAAGTILRSDALVEGHLYASATSAETVSKPYLLGMYRDIRRTVRNSLVYLGNLRALHHWYRDVRRLFLQGDVYREACYQGALNRLEVVFQERVQRLEEMAGKMPHSMELLLQNGEIREGRIYTMQKELRDGWAVLKQELQQDVDPDPRAEARDRLLQGLARIPGGLSYVDTIQSLDAESREAGTAWLQGIVDRVSTLLQL